MKKGYKRKQEGKLKERIVRKMIKGDMRKAETNREMRSSEKTTKIRKEKKN